MSNVIGNQSRELRELKTANLQPFHRKITERLYQTRFKVFKENHLIVDKSKCIQCADKPCILCCPANVYRWDGSKESGRLIVEYDGCLECGACEVVCPYSKITLTYPPAGHGVNFRYG